MSDDKVVPVTDPTGYFDKDRGDPLWIEFEKWAYRCGQVYGQKSHRRKAWEAFRVAWWMGFAAAKNETLGAKEIQQ